MQNSPVGRNKIFDLPEVVWTQVILFELIFDIQAMLMLSMLD